MLLATTVSADGPALFSVTGVSSDDELNIREEPSATSDIIGIFAPDAMRIEVIGTDASGSWAEVGIGDVNGWVANRYLTPETVDTDSIPRPMRCFGAEPFWGLSLPEDFADVYDDPETGPALMGDLVIDEGTSFGYVAQYVTGSFNDVRVLVVTRQICSDGMADRLFGWEAILTFRETGSTRAVSGCCTFDGGAAEWR